MLTTLSGQVCREHPPALGRSQRCPLVAAQRYNCGPTAAVARCARAAPRVALKVVAMRAVMQRVKSASVEVEGSIVSKIGQGWLCLVGLTNDDTEADAEYICKKILKTKGWKDPDSGSPWAKDVAAVDGDILLVSQFTLYGRLKKPKPDYSKAMGPEQAREFYQSFVERVRAAYIPERVHDGVFGAMMDVALVNDGPVTFIIDSGHQGAGQQ